MSTRTPLWWRGAVVYHVFLPSFYDGNGDGIGDLPGLISKLGYIRDLGVDAIWITPFFVSPRKDYGYDVADYCRVDPVFGTLADADALIEQAHECGLRVMFDHVVSHTSDRHPWFIESSGDRSNAKADWYVWADPKPDGGPPNNWISVFGGSSWRWNPQRRQYYLHNFLPEQPSLNYRTPGVLAAMLDTMAFWLDRGVDGFRLDAITALVADKQLRDNPPASQDKGAEAPSFPANPFFLQDHVYDRDRPELESLLHALRRLTDQYPDRVLMGEIGDCDAVATACAYTQGRDRLHMATNFSLCGTAASGREISAVIARTESLLGDGWLAHSLSNTEAPRAASRLYRGGDRAAAARLGLALLAALKGSVCLYQGEELGLPDAWVPEDKRHDPFGRYFAPFYPGRDGCRVPIPWNRAGPGMGFTSAEPWLPMSEEYRALSVEAQMADNTSTLRFCKRLLALRKTLGIRDLPHLGVLEAPESGVVLERWSDTKRCVAAFNMSNNEVVLKNAAFAESEPISDLSERFSLDGGGVTLGPYGFVFAWVYGDNT